MRLKAYFILFTVVLISILPNISRAASEDEFGNRLKCNHYAAVVAAVPKDKDLDISPGFTYGMQWRNDNEAVFLDATFFESDASSSILWFSGEVRNTMFRLGYKRPVTKSKKFLLGVDVQSQHMDFGSRKINAVTIGALAEYKLTGSWTVQMESSQKTKRSGVYFGNFSTSIIKNL